VNDDVLRVMTYNLLSAEKKRRRFPWTDRRDSVADLIERLDPDVIGTQEANFKQIRDLQQRLPQYGVVAAGNLGPHQERHDSNWYSTVFYHRERIERLEQPGERFWLSPDPNRPASRFALASRPRVAVWALLRQRSSGQRFLFGTTHLEAFMPGHRRAGARLLQQYVGRKLRELGEEIPVFLTGDFNARSDAAEIRHLQLDTAHGPAMLDAWREAGLDESRHGATFRGLDLRDRVGNWLLGHRRIDYVFFRPRLELHGVERVDYAKYLGLGQVPPSDHDPVMASFKLAG
jgi:endonuclease/exonuclease/phosphatase family metal-dependent hydrolase